MGIFDLHIHSEFSADGELSPERIVDLADQSGASHISMTDHNCVRGCERFEDTAKHSRVLTIPGVELDCLFDGLNLHILGLGIDYQDPAFHEWETFVVDQERKTLFEMIRELKGLGFGIETDDVYDDVAEPPPAPESLAEYLLHSAANNDMELLKPYRTGGARSGMPFFHFYQDYLAPGKICHVPTKYHSLEHAIQLVTSTGGTPILAHPGGSLTEPVKQLPKIMQAGVEGIEVFSSYHNSSQTKYYLEVALLNDLNISCGSDFHGKNKPSIAIGSISCAGYEDKILELFHKCL